MRRLSEEDGFWGRIARKSNPPAIGARINHNWDSRFIVRHAFGLIFVNEVTQHSETGLFNEEAMKLEYYIVAHLQFCLVIG